MSGRKIDSSHPCVLKAEMAKKNLHTKRILSVQIDHSLKSFPYMNQIDPKSFPYINNTRRKSAPEQFWDPYAAAQFEYQGCNSYSNGDLFPLSTITSPTLMEAPCPLTDEFDPFCQNIDTPAFSQSQPGAYNSNGIDIPTFSPQANNSNNIDIPSSQSFCRPIDQYGSTNGRQTSGSYTRNQDGSTSGSYSRNLDVPTSGSYTRNQDTSAIGSFTLNQDIPKSGSYSRNQYTSASGSYANPTSLPKSDSHTPTFFSVNQSESSFYPIKTDSFSLAKGAYYNSSEPISPDDSSFEPQLSYPGQSHSRGFSSVLYNSDQLLSKASFPTESLSKGFGSMSIGTNSYDTLPYSSSFSSATPSLSGIDQNPPCNTLYVGNLLNETTEQELYNLFAPCPGYKRLCLKSRNTGPMCFVEVQCV